MIRRTVLGATLCLACNAPDPPPSTGGTDNVDPCGRALVVVSSDYQSTNVSFVGFDLTVLSESVVSSGSTSPELTAALSGDVVTPTSSLANSDQLVLIDRYPAAVLTFVDVETGKVTSQLSVKTGFSSNPQDYLPLADGRAYVSRYEQNPNPGTEPFDQGSDLLIVDPDAPAITGRVDLSAAMTDVPTDILPRPGRMVRQGDRAYVLLAALSADFQTGADSRIAVVDTATDKVVDAIVLPGARGCTALALSPDATSLAVGCSGTFGGASAPDLTGAGVHVVDLTSQSVSALSADELGGPVAFWLSYDAVGNLLVPLFGSVDGDGNTAVPDRLVTLPHDAGVTGVTPSTVLQTDAFALGEARCTVSCGCFVADAGTSELVNLTPTSLAVKGSVSISASLGLPPRVVGHL